MRIIGGRFRGRTITAPKGLDVRPTSDRAREGVFNILAHGIDWPGFDGITVIDVFSGAGGYGLEALSRGAGHAVFIDNDANSLKCARGNAAACGQGRNVNALKLDAARLPPPPRVAKTPVPLAFLDAPYGQNLTGPALLGLAHRGWLAPAAVVVVEVGGDEDIAAPKGYGLMDERTYGAARIGFFRYEKTPRQAE